MAATRIKIVADLFNVTSDRETGQSKDFVRADDMKAPRDRSSLLVEAFGF